MKLKGAAIVRSGLVLSRKLAKQRTEHHYSALNLRCIDAAGIIDTAQLDAFNATEPLNPEYLTQPGDIVVRLTAPYTAVLIDDGTAGLVISSNFVVIRADRTKVLPEYLIWLLNTEHSRRSIYMNATSNALSAINARYFDELSLPPVNLSDQQKIGDLNRLAQREEQLLRTLADAKQKYYAQLIDTIHQDMEG